MQSMSLLIVGLAAGILSGLLGIGGGILIVPCLVWFFGLSQHTAQGTTLALMVPPIGLLAAWTYYRHGYVDLRVAVLVGLGFLLGGLVGARCATAIDELLLRRLFGIMMLVAAIKMLLGR